MKKLLAAVALFGGSMAMVPAPAHAGGSTDAALALGAFAVLNQIVRGETIFQAPRPVVMQQPVVVQQPVIVGSPPVVYVAPPPPPPVVYAPPPVYAPPVPVVVYPRAYAPYYGYYHAQYRRHYQYDDD